MKQIIALCFIAGSVFTLKAQTPTFEETVNYINDKIRCCSSYESLSISASKNGDVILIHPDGDEIFRFNFFIIENDVLAEYPYLEIIKVYKGIRFAKKKTDDGAYTLSISIAGFSFIPNIRNEDIGNKLMKAFEHLRSLCTKEKDPFDD